MNPLGAECHFRCGAPVRPGLDWKCNVCNTAYHYVCAGLQQHDRTWVYSCLKCGSRFTDTTVAYWATATFEHLPLEERLRWGLVDVNFIHHGKVVAFLAYKPKTLEDGRITEWEERHPTLSANLTNAESEWVVDNWYTVTRKLWAVDMDKF